MYEYREGQGIFNIELDQEVTEFGTYECTDGTYIISPDGVSKVISSKGATALVLPYQSWIDNHKEVPKIKPVALEDITDTTSYVNQISFGLINQIATLQAQVNELKGV